MAARRMKSVCRMPMPEPGSSDLSPDISPRALAYLGDAVYELFVREIAIKQLEAGHLAKAEALHQFSVSRVKAEFQVSLVHYLESWLTEPEKEIIRRGRNVAVGSNRRSDQSRHRQATGFEALVGYLYRNDASRLQALFETITPLVLAWSVDTDSPGR